MAWRHCSSLIESLLISLERHLVMLCVSRHDLTSRGTWKMISLWHYHFTDQIPLQQHVRALGHAWQVDYIIIVTRTESSWYLRGDRVETVHTSAHLRKPARTFNSTYTSSQALVTDMELYRGPCSTLCVLSVNKCTVQTVSRNWHYTLCRIKREQNY